MNMEFEKTIELNADDLYNYYLTVGTKPYKKLIILYFAALGLLSGCLDRPVFALLVISAIVTFIVFFLLFAYQRIKANRILKSSRLAQMPKQIRLDDKGVHVNSEIESTNIPWQDFDRTVETKHAFYLLFYMQSGYIIPKRLLEANEMAAIRSMLIEKSPDKETPLSDEY